METKIKTKKKKVRNCNNKSPDKTLEWRIIKGYSNYEISEKGDINSFNYNKTGLPHLLLWTEHKSSGHKVIELFNKKGSKKFYQTVLMKENFPEIDFPKVGKKLLYQYDSEGELVEVYDNASDAVKVGFNQTSISSCCNYSRSTHYGFTFSYTDLLTRERNLDIINLFKLNGLRVKLKGDLYNPNIYLGKIKLSCRVSGKRLILLNPDKLKLEVHSITITSNMSSNKTRNEKITNWITSQNLN